MKKIPLNYLHGYRLLIAAAVIVFLLQSCCLHPRYLEGAKRPCNCKNDPELAKNKPLPVPASNQGVLTYKPQQPVSAVERKEVSQPVQITAAVYTNNVLQEKKMEELLLPRKTPRTEKNLPLGIKGISTSIVAGPNISFKSSKEDYGNTNHKHSPGVGIVIGIGTTYYFSEKFAVSTSLLFKQNNASEKLSYTIPGDPGSPGSSSETDTKYNYSYLSAPVLAQIKLSDQLTAVVGPEINYLLGASTKQSGNSEKNKITDNSVKVGAGAQVGLRYEIPNSPIGIQLLYDQRLSRLNKKAEVTDYVPGGGGGGGYEIPAWNMKSIQLGVTCSLCELMKKK
jgi:hypothetical protein